MQRRGLGEKWIRCAAFIKKSKREKAPHRQRIAQKNTSPKTLTGKVKGIEFWDFLKTVGSMTGIFEVLLLSGIET